MNFSCCSEADDSDTDSESIIIEAFNANHMVYAEVLYNFKAVGAEELSLERGALVEVMRIESGPWWWGRIKHDAILSNQNSQQSEGWFPRDFVRVSRNRFSFASMDIDFNLVALLIALKCSCR